MVPFTRHIRSVTISFLFPSGYYDGATELYEYGWAKSFHFSRFYKGEAFAASLARHEHYLASQMTLRPGMRVLDVGCGVGGPAREIARFADVNIVGLNNNDFQIGRARQYTKDARPRGSGPVRERRLYEALGKIWRELL
jgi:sterol 24-C-methyltransferase